MKKDSQRVNDESPLDKADYNINQWLIENTRTPRLPLPRNSILSRSNIENTQPFLEVGQLVTHEGKDLLENGLVLLQYDKALSNLVGLAVQDADKKTVYIGKRGTTAFNIGLSIRKDLVLCSSKLPIAIKAAETGYQVALSDYGTLHSCLDQGVVLLSCDDDLFAGKELVNLTAKEMRRLVDDAYRKEKENSLKAQYIYSLDEIKYSSDKTAAEILDQLSNEQDPFKCSQLAYAYTFKTLPNIPYKESLKSVRAKLEGKLNGVMLDLILERAKWILDKKKELALKAITIHDTKQHGHLVINNFDELSDLNYKGVILVKAPTGMGKTQKVGKPFAEWCQSKNYTLVSVAHLRSLISELSSRLNTSHYEDEKETYKQARKAGIETQGFIDSLSVCLPSLLSDAYSKFMSNVRYVFIDEITQVLNVFASEKVFSSTDVEQVFLFFKDLIAKAECLIVADANINQQTFDFIESCRPNERFNIVEIKPKNEHKKAWLYESDKELTSKILNDVIALNKKVWITCDSPKQGRLLYELFSSREIKARLILGQDHKIKGSVEFLKDVSNESLNYQVVIASPAISSGVSVEHEIPYFDYVAGFFCGTSVRSADAYQMLGRVRYAKEFHLSLSQKSNAVISHENVIAAKQTAAELEGGKVEVTSLTRHLERIAEHDSEDKNSFANNLYYMLEHYHFEIMRAVYAYDPTLDLAGIRKELNEADKQGILNAQVITAEQADKFRRSDYLERPDYYALKAFDKRMYLNMSYDAKLTEQHLEINVAQLKRLNAFCGRYEAATDKSRDLSLRNFSEATAKLYKDAFSCIDLKGGAAYDEAVAKQILDHIEPHRLKLAAIGAIPKGFGCDRYKRKKSAIKELNSIFTHIGISQKRINNPYNRTERKATIGHMPHNLYRNIGGMCPLSGDKVYLIDEQKLEQQQLLIEIHAVKSNAIELKTVSDQVQDKEPSNQSPYFAAMPNDVGFYAIDPDDDYWQTGTG